MEYTGKGTEEFDHTGFRRRSLKSVIESERKGLPCSVPVTITVAFCWSLANISSTFTLYQPCDCHLIRIVCVGFSSCVRELRGVFMFFFLTKMFLEVKKLFFSFSRLNFELQP